MYDRIKALCELKSISITSLCEEMTGNSGNLATWKKNNFKIDMAIRLANYFSVSLDYLLMGKDANQIGIHNNGNNNLNLANNGNNNNFFANQHQLTEFELQLLKTYNSLTTPKKMELLTFALKLENKED